MSTPRPSADSLIRWLVLIAIVSGWYLGSLHAPAYLFPSPLRVFDEAVLLFTHAGLRMHVATTLLHIFLSIALAIGSAFLLVFVARSVPLIGPFIETRLVPLINAVPSIGWTLLAVIWFGLDTTTVVFAITAMLLPFNIINLSQGIQTMNQEILEMAESFTGSRFRRYLYVCLPLLAPFLFATLRLNFNVSWKIALTAELLGGNRGLGFLMNLAMQDQNTTRILAIALSIVAFVYVADVRLLEAMQNRFNSRFRTR